MKPGKRAHFEPLIEMMQIEGNSEVRRKFGPAGEFAGFENADSMASCSGRVADARNVVRWGVVEGLAWENKLGFVGGTDDHNGLTSETMEAGSFGQGRQGAHGAEDGSVQKRRSFDVGGWIDGKDQNPGADGKLPRVGNTVDRATARDTNDIGAAELKGVFKDPEFDPAHAPSTTPGRLRSRPRAGPCTTPSSTR